MDKMMFEFRKWLFKKRRDLSSIILYVTAGGMLLLMVIGYNGLFKPLKTRYMEQMNLMYTYNFNVASIPDLALTSDIMNKKVGKIKTVYSQLNDIVPDKRNVPFVTSQISLAASSNNVNIGSMQKKLEKTVSLGKQVFGVVKYDLKTFSTYEDMVNLLATIETSNSIFAIDSISINPLSEEEVAMYKDPAFIKGEIGISIYMKSN